MVLTSPVIIVIVCVGTPSRRGGPGAGASPGIKKQPSLGGLGKRRTTNLVVVVVEEEEEEEEGR